MNNIEYSKEVYYIGILGIIISIYKWSRDIIKEGSYKGEHTEKVQRNLTIGFILFIISEISLFLSLFISYFYNSLIPSIEIGGIWPPIGIETLDYKSVPLLNTIILLSSGLTITACHNYLIYANYKSSILYLILTLFLGFLFSYFQYFEYWNSLFTLSDSIYGASFFVLTGCHALHIIVGTSLLLISLLIYSHFTTHHHLFFSFSSIYWHVVDLIWLFLFFLLYFLSSY